MIDILISILKDYGAWGLIFVALVYLGLTSDFSFRVILVLKKRQGKAVKGLKVWKV